jgi:hypothetical protein
MTKSKKYFIVIDSDEQVNTFKIKLDDFNIDYSKEDLEKRLNSYHFTNQTVSIFVDEVTRKITKWKYRTPDKVI